MYVAVKGGEAAIDAAHRLLDRDRRGDPAVPELTVEQIATQLRLGVDRVMAEGALYDPALAALAIKQAAGDIIEAIFLLRAYRTTLPRLAVSEPVETAKMRADRRISAIFKDVPGGQFLGPTFDYTHRLLDFDLAGEAAARSTADATGHEAARSNGTAVAPTPAVTALLEQDGLVARESIDPEAETGDITRDPPTYPASRDVRLQTLARGDEGFLLSLAYSTQRGYGRNHPFAGEIRSGHVTVEIVPPELGFAIEIGEIELTECQMVNQFKGSATQPPQFTRGYGLAFGRGERKAMAMALVDRSLRAAEYEEEVTAPAQDEEFVLSHADNVEASGFVQHLKLPHYVDFQAELDVIRRLRGEEKRQEAAE
ncbi:MAG: carbon-phosphorus lyase complex subunit PhnI [Dongiaceae bacterium]